MTKDELAAVVAALEEEYESADKAARAVYNLSVDMFCAQDSWIAVTWGIPFELWGPFRDKTVANRLIKLYDGEVTLVQANGTATLEDRERKIDIPVGDHSCETCKHPKFAHYPKTKKYQKKWGCLVSGCNCQIAYKEGA